MSDYISSLTGPEMDAALLDMARHNSEAWAVGTRNGRIVDPSDETYHNNSKYWAGQAANYISGDVSGAVRWDVAQSLADAQKAQARANMGAAPTNNPTFTGDVNVPVQAWNDSSTKAANTNYVTEKFLVMLNRLNPVNQANTEYVNYMARGESLNPTETTPTVNGTIAWLYE